jgi:hypothetical protein
MLVRNDCRCAGGILFGRHLEGCQNREAGRKKTHSQRQLTFDYSTLACSQCRGAEWPVMND